MCQRERVRRGSRPSMNGQYDGASPDTLNPMPTAASAIMKKRLQDQPSSRARTRQPHRSSDPWRSPAPVAGRPSNKPPVRQSGHALPDDPTEHHGLRHREECRHRTTGKVPVPQTTANAMARTSHPASEITEPDEPPAVDGLLLGRAIVSSYFLLASQQEHDDGQVRAVVRQSRGANTVGDRHVDESARPRSSPPPSRPIRARPRTKKGFEA